MVRGVYRIERDREVVGEKVGRKSAVGMNAADLSGGDKDCFGFGLRHEALDRF